MDLLALLDHGFDGNRAQQQSLVKNFRPVPVERAKAMNDIEKAIENSWSLQLIVAAAIGFLFSLTDIIF